MGPPSLLGGARDIYPCRRCLCISYHHDGAAICARHVLQQRSVYSVAVAGLCVLYAYVTCVRELVVCSAARCPVLQGTSQFSRTRRRPSPALELRPHWPQPGRMQLCARLTSDGDLSCRLAWASRPAHAAAAGQQSPAAARYGACQLSSAAAARCSIAARSCSACMQLSLAQGPSCPSSSSVARNSRLQRGLRPAISHRRITRVYAF